MDKSETKIVYSYDTDGLYICEKTLDWTDRSQISGAWQIPAQCTEIKPPILKEGFEIVFKNGWQYQEIPKSERPTLPEPPNQQEHEYIDKNILDLAEAVAAQEARLQKLEGGTK